MTFCVIQFIWLFVSFNLFLYSHELSWASTCLRLHVIVSAWRGLMGAPKKARTAQLGMFESQVAIPWTHSRAWIPSYDVQTRIPGHGSLHATWSRFADYLQRKMQTWETSRDLLVPAVLFELTFELIVIVWSRGRGWILYTVFVYYDGLCKSNLYISILSTWA